MNLLNLGCGNTFHKDWINIDFVSKSKYVKAHDLLEGIPFKNNSIDVVYHSHVLEHFSKSDGIEFLRECKRVLNRNGIIRIAVPDLEIIAKEYLKNLDLAIKGDIGAKQNYEWIKLELFDQMIRNVSGGEMKQYLFQENIPNESYVYNRIGMEGKNLRKSYLNKIKKSKTKKSKTFRLRLIFSKIIKKINRIKENVFQKKSGNSETIEYNIGKFRMGGEIHQWMYDRYALTKLLGEIGFTDIKICSAFESSIDNWESYQLDVVKDEVRKPDSLFIEARKK